MNFSEFIATLLISATLITAQDDTMSVVVNLNCDNYAAIFVSTDNFATYDTELSPILANGQIDPNRKGYATGILSFTARKDATIRLACWDHGGGRYLSGTITVDGTVYTVGTDDTFFEYIGFEETCETNNVCTDHGACLLDIPDTLLNPNAIPNPNPGDSLVYHGHGYWPEAETEKCGIFWVELLPYDSECPIAEAQTFDWDTLTRDGTGKPVVTWTIDVDESAGTDLALNIEVRVPYIVLAKADDQIDYNFGTTYVLDFEDFDAHHSSITEPNSCSNRLASSYPTTLEDNDRFKISSEEFRAIGTDANMCYPLPGGEDVTGWDIDYDASDCDTIVYKGRWEWGELRACKNHINALTNANGEQTFVSEDDDFLKLSGTFYVNIVSPFWNENNDDFGDYYRVYQLISQPFLIQISKSVYVIGKTGINVMTMSIISVYKERQDLDYTLILLTETAEYMQLESPHLLVFPDGNNGQSFSLVMQSTDESNGCLNNKAYLCSQLWKVFAIDTICTQNIDNGGGIDFSGNYKIRFNPSCRALTVSESGYDGTTHCTDWLNDHPIYKNDGIDDNGIQNGVILESQLQFVDGICEAKTFTVQLEASMNFYEDDGYSTSSYINPETSPHLYQVGEDTVYGEIILNFPTATEDIFDSTLVNVWLCTFPPGTDPDELDMNGQSGGCFSANRDGFENGDVDDEFFFHVYSTQETPTLATEDFVVTNPGNDVIHFEFTVPNEIQRDTLYVHAQVSVLLEQEAPRRLLLNINMKPNGKTTNKIAHFGQNIGITNKPNNKPEIPPQQPYEPIQEPQLPLNQPFTISLNSSWVIIIGVLLSIILVFNIIFMCYMNCCKGNNGRPRISFNKNRRGGYDSVKHVDSEEFDDSEANLINVN